MNYYKHYYRQYRRRSYGRRNADPRLLAAGVGVAAALATGAAHASTGHHHHHHGPPPAAASRAHGISAAGGSNEQTANRMAAARYGWAGGQRTCLDELWTRESNFGTTATNQQSGAYGIPQSLPAGKMAAAGPDWRTNPVTQIRWGLGYIKGRYGSPCGAWAHEEADSWY